MAHNVVVNELTSEVRREMKNFSSVGGLRQTILFHFSVITHLKNIRNNFTIYLEQRSCCYIIYPHRNISHEAQENETIYLSD